MKIIIDGRSLLLYPLGKEGFTGGTELMVRVIAKGLADKGHSVHVVTADLDDEEERGPNLTYWGPKAFPTKADTVMMVPSIELAQHYSANSLVLMTNGIDPYLGPDGNLAELVAAFPIFSQTHGKLMCAANPTIDPKRCVITGLGVDLADYPINPVKVPGRIWVGNDPSRGLWHVLDIFEKVRAEAPHATLSVTYDFERQFQQHKWRQNSVAEMMRECRNRLKTMPGVVVHGNLDRAGVIAEQLAAEFHVWPSDPNNVGSQIHGIAQMEAAAAGCVLVLSDTEAFPEVFDDAAIILPVPGTFQLTDDGDGERVDAQDYADRIVELINDQEEFWIDHSKLSRGLAEENTWSHVVDRYDAMLEMIK